MMGHLSSLFEYRELLWILSLKEIKIRYKEAALGIAWAILQPLALMVVFTVIFSHFARLPSDGVPYPIFVFSALVPWTFFASSLTSAISSLERNVGLITKIYFPREIFPLAAILGASIDFAIAFLLFIGMLVFYKVSPTFNILFFFPIVFIQVTLMAGMSLFLAGVNVFYRDVRFVIPLVIQVWMFASPVIYPLSLVPEKWRALYMLNPMAGIIDSYRRALLQGVPPDLQYLGYSLFIAGILLTIAYWYFKKIEMLLADEMGS